jgi:GNAT superfamily N-acetyltransferase
MACADEPASSREFSERRVADQRRIAEAGHGSWFGAFQGGRLAAQLGLYSDGGPIARYQNVETHPSARRQGLAGTLVYHAGRYGLDTLGARTLVMVADPGYSAIRIYRSAGFADLETQVTLQREPARA